MSTRGRVTGTSSQTVTEPGQPLVEDQIRDYRRAQRARHEAARVARNIGNIGRTIVGRQPREHTLALLMNPEVELQRSMQERARTVPAEVLYMTRRDDIHHRVYHHRSEERMLVLRNDQQDRTFIQQESYEALAQAGLEYIHLGVLQVRFQILHRRYAGTVAFLVFRDTRWNEDDRSIIAAMEVDLAEGNQLVYVIPDIMMTIKDFYRHIQISIKTKGYDTWEGGEANLLITRSITSRLSNTPNVGFAYKIERVAEYLRSKGVKAINATKHSAKQFQGGEWTLKPSRVVVPMQPSSMNTSTKYDGSISIRFGDYEASTSSRPPKYNTADDEIDSDEEHTIAMITEEIDEWLILAEELGYDLTEEVEDVPPEQSSRSMVGEEKIISQFLEKLELEEETTSMASLNIAMMSEYPELKKISELVNASSEVTSSYRPPEIDMTGPAGYAPATSQQGWASSHPPTSGRNFRYKDPSGYFALPSAQQQNGSILLLSPTYDTKIFERWESTTLNHMADKSFATAEDKLIYLENLLGEMEKKTFQTWRMAFPTEFELMKTQALGANGTQNSISQIRRIFYLEDPKTGSTTSQDAAYKAIKSLVCTDMSGIAIKRYMNSYMDLAATSGRMWVSAELSDEFFTKLPNGLGDRVAKAFKEKHPGNTVGVPARVTFTQNYLEEVCREAAYQRSLKNLDFCKEFPVPGYYKKPGYKYGRRKTTTYKGKPHKTHVRIDKRKHLKNRKCKCYACGEEGHYASECRNKKQYTDRVNIIENIALKEDEEIVSVGEDEDEVSDIWSLSEGEDGHGEEEVAAMVFALEDEEEDTLIGKPGTWRSQVRVTRKEYECIHLWDFNSEGYEKCKACRLEARANERMKCKECKMVICCLCSNYCFDITIPRERSFSSQHHEPKWKEIATALGEINAKLEQEKKALIEELNRALEQIKDYKQKGLPTAIIQEVDESKTEELERENELLNAVLEKKDKEIKDLKERLQWLSQEKVQMLTEEDEKVFSASGRSGPRYNGLYNVKVGIEVEKEIKYLNAIVDTGATTCVVREARLTEKMLEESPVNVTLRGMNSISRASKVVKQGKIWIGEQYFRTPRTFALDISLSGGIDMILGCNFIRSLEGGVRIEGNDITFYKLVTSVRTQREAHQVAAIEELDLNEDEYYDIAISDQEKAYINKEIVDSSIFRRLKELGYIGEEPLKHWRKNQVKCSLEIKNPDMIIEDRPLKHVTPKMKEQMKKHVDKLLELKVIRPSTSKHRTTAMIVESGTEIDPKTGQEKRGKERLVFNYKRLNDNTEKDQYSLPGINTIIQRIGRSKIYSKFDLKSGFHQVAMEEASIPWTAFWAIDGLYEWLVMPFGLKNAPAVFQRKMDNCFRGTEEFIAVYIDDILIFSESPQQHVQHLKKFMEICEKNGLVLSPTKMKIGVSQVDFLGATIGQSKIRLQPHIIKKIADFEDEKLKETKGLRSWLGILNYARNYIPNLGKTLGPLYSKVSPTGEKRMNHQDWVLINKVKRQVKELEDMELPPVEACIVLETDGCMEGWGGVCKWKLPGQNKASEKICAYASGKFSPIKSTIDAEIQAVINSLDKFKIYYLDKKKIIIRTDCQAIVAFYSKIAQNKPSRVRWLTFSDFISGLGVQVSFEHIDGKDNTIANTLSRLVHILIKEEDQELINKIMVLWEKKTEDVMHINDNPLLVCGCGIPAVQRESRTSRNPNRKFVTCRDNRCRCWWWSDNIDDYTRRMIDLAQEEADYDEAMRRYHEELQEKKLDLMQINEALEAAEDQDRREGVISDADFEPNVIRDD
ncbi:ORF3 protein [Sugarcane bacilliform Guadeloupe D virus]|uniref:RNA-directed DNA polymerase n=1 Tax=Sugarcane bacilliform Guadeloupe D virus TaxID=1960253 RepID=D0QEI9_9VIRU|nr:ORF3 protein [Sugarcane bacilliform Guadeloupe D virus]ACS44708.1 ORF3 protein [Sugarcane bacilliform Guadeloupe D virus]